MLAILALAGFLLIGGVVVNSRIAKNRVLKSVAEMEEVSRLWQRRGDVLKQNDPARAELFYERAMVLDIMARRVKYGESKVEEAGRGEIEGEEQGLTIQTIVKLLGIDNFIGPLVIVARQAAEMDVNKEPTPEEYRVLGALNKNLIRKDKDIYREFILNLIKNEYDSQNGRYQGNKPIERSEEYAIAINRVRAYLRNVYGLEGPQSNDEFVEVAQEILGEDIFTMPKNIKLVTFGFFLEDLDGDDDARPWIGKAKFKNFKFDLKNGVIKGKGEYKSETENWSIDLNGKIDPGSKEVEGSFKGTSSKNLGGKDLGGGLSKTDFSGTWSGAFVSQTKWRDGSTVWWWTGRTNLIYSGGFLDTSKFDGFYARRPPKPGTKDKGEFSLEIFFLNEPQ